MPHNSPPELQTLQEIRHLMERSSRFISLSGMSGVFAGIYAIAGAYAAYRFLGLEGVGEYGGDTLSNSNGETLRFLAIDALIIVVLAIATGIFLTTRKASKDGNSIFDRTAKKLVLNVSIPLLTGGIFCLLLVYHNAFLYVAPCMLIFYGMALLHGSSFTRSDVRYLGLLEILLGLLAMYFLGYGLFFWTLGFGVMHILYGTYMYYKYEK